MKIAATLAFCAALGAAAAAPSIPAFQDSTSPAGSPLQPVGQADAEASGGTQDGRPSAPRRPFLTPGAPGDAVAPATGLGELEESFRERLTTPDLEARMETFQEVAEQAATNAAARAALQAIADDTADVDLAFSARLALREADRISTWGRAGSAFGGQGFRVPDDPFDAMRRQMDSIFGSDPFVNDAFKNDPFFQRGFGGSRNLFGPDPFGGVGAESMRERVERMREEMETLRRDALRGGLRGGGAPGTAPGGRQWGSRSSSISVQSTGDGVRVEVTEDDGDGPKTEIYEAPSMEELLKAHPELKGRVR